MSDEMPLDDDLFAAPQGRSAGAGVDAGRGGGRALDERDTALDAEGGGRVLAGFIVPGLPHPLLVPDANPAYRKLRDAYAEVRAQIEALQPDLLLLYSTQWPSVIGHQVQTDPAPEWTHVDQEWHELGAIPYKFRVDPAFGQAYVAAGKARGLEMREVAYHGFPVDTGSIVALKLLNPDNRFPASIVSCNMYADRSETIVLGKAARDAIAATGKRVVAVAVTLLSSRFHSAVVPFAQDRIHSLKDDEWNRKYLEILGQGRLEDASQLARKFSHEANGDQKLKAVWWLAATCGQDNRYEGRVVEYQPVYGTGAALVSLVPVRKKALEPEFDEDDPEFHGGDRNVLGGASRFESAEGVDLALRGVDLDEATGRKRARQQLVAGKEAEPAAASPAAPTAAPAAAPPAPAGAGVVLASAAPKPVGAYPHARRVGDLLYLSGLGPRDPRTNEVPGGPVWGADGKRRDYDVRAQTEAVVANMKTVLREAGATIDDVVDVTVYLIDMQRDFAAFNEVYARHFGKVQATRTTVEVNRLPTPIAVEFKVVAKAQAGA